MWVGVAHGAQYLWITSYYARSSGDWRGPGRYFTRTFLFSSVAWTVPIIVFGASIQAGPVGVRPTLADVGQTVATHLGLDLPLPHGTSVL